MRLSVQYRDLELGSCRMRNSSRDGFAVETGLIRLPRGIVVKVNGELPVGGRGVNLVALVVHSEVGRAGLWIGDDLHQQEMLQALVAQQNGPALQAVG